MANSLPTLIEASELPPEVHESIDAYLAKHDDSDDHDEQRLQEELIALYKTYVSKDKDKFSGFLLVLQALRSGLGGQSHFQYWWKTLLQPIVDGVGQTRLNIQTATTLILHVLDYDDEGGAQDEEAVKLSTHFAKVLLDAYLKRTRLVDLEDEAANHENDFVASQLCEILTCYGRKKPKVRPCDTWFQHY